MPRGRPRKTDKKLTSKSALTPRHRSVRAPTRKPRAKPTGSVVYAIRHQDKRANIPTEELRDFVRAAEEKPAIVFYPRDPSLDPQLVWKGKDEQDSKDLAVPAVNNHGGFGRWAFLEIRDPWNAKNEIMGLIDKVKNE